MTHEHWPLSFHTGRRGQPGRYFDIYLNNPYVLSSSLFFSRPLFVLSRFFPSNGWFGISHLLLVLLSEHLSQPHVHLLIYTVHFGQFHHPLPACQMTFSLALWPTTWYPTLLSSIILVSNLLAPNLYLYHPSNYAHLFFEPWSFCSTFGCLQNWESTVAFTRR